MKRNTFQPFFICSLIVNAQQKQTKDRYLTRSGYPVGLICLSKKIPEPFS
jgi:hypothetical protein